MFFNGKMLLPKKVQSLLGLFIEHCWSLQLRQSLDVCTDEFRRVRLSYGSIRDVNRGFVVCCFHSF